MSADLFPVFLKLEGRRVLVVGGGNVGLEKIASLSTSGARLRVVAPLALDPVQEMATSKFLVWEPREFRDEDVDEADLVITATDRPEVNAAVYRAARQRGVLCNSADDPPNCDFYFASLVRRGHLQIAISTAGDSPALAQQLRREIDAALPGDIGQSLAALGQLRREVIASHPAGEERKRLLHTLASRQVCTLPECPSRQLALAALEGKS
jgi:siroheme synthase-like protein